MTRRCIVHRRGRHKNHLDRPSASLAHTARQLWRFLFPHKRATKRLKDMNYFLPNWPSLYRSQPNNKTVISALQKQRKIVAAMLATKRLVCTEPVKR